MNILDKMPNRADLTESADEKRIPYRHPQPKHSPPELVIPDVVTTDERLWVPQAENVWFRPLCLSASRGYWQNLLGSGNPACCRATATRSRCTAS